MIFFRGIHWNYLVVALILRFKNAFLKNRKKEHSIKFLFVIVGWIGNFNCLASKLTELWESPYIISSSRWFFPQTILFWQFFPGQIFPKTIFLQTIFRRTILPRTTLLHTNFPRKFHRERYIGICYIVKTSTGFFDPKPRSSVIELRWGPSQIKVFPHILSICEKQSMFFNWYHKVIVKYKYFGKVYPWKHWK
jgi:hypothetical protein